MPPLTEAAVQRLIRAFEAGSLPKGEWTHAAHLAVGAHYAMTCDSAQAMAHLRAGIRHLNECHGVVNSDSSGYHETLTRFWLMMITQFLADQARQTPHLTPVERVNAAVAAFAAQQRLFMGFWSTNIVASKQARHEWVAPDLTPLQAPQATADFSTRCGWEMP